MALSNEEVQFRERIAKFIGTVTTKIDHIKGDINKLEQKEDDCKKEISEKISEIEKQINSINTTIKIEKALIATIGGIAGFLLSIAVLIAKHYFLSGSP